MKYPCADDLRLALLKRAEALSVVSGISLTKLAKAAVGDGGFFGSIRSGANFEMRTYERAMAWLEAQEKHHRATTPGLPRRARNGSTRDAAGRT
jgi:hypothetical protein